MQMRLIIAFFMTVLLVGHAYAAAADDFTSLLNSTKTMRASFKQTVYDNRGKAIQHASGKMALERPGKFRWELVKPLPQIIIANAHKLWIYDPDLQQVTIRVLKQTTGETPALLLSHVDAMVEKDYQIKWLASTSNKREFELLPKNRDDIFSAVIMVFLDKHIQEMRLIDNLGHKTVITFNNVQVNSSLPSSLFVFNKPTGVDVIDETNKK